MKARAIFAILSVIPLGCATESSDPPNNGLGTLGGGGTGAGMNSGGSAVADGGSATPAAGSGTSGTSVVPGGGNPRGAGTLSTAGTLSPRRPHTAGNKGPPGGP